MVFRGRLHVKVAVGLILTTFVFGFVPTNNHQSRNYQIANSRKEKIISVTRPQLQRKDEDNIIISTSFDIAVSPKLSPLESWCVTHMELLYSRSLSMKCPFFRRRMTDFLDATDMVMRFLVIRHKSLDLIGPPPGCRSTKMSRVKVSNLSMEDLCDVIRKDWREDTNKGYYITGKLNTTIYRDDCLFDGPDPDMPVRGLRKYLNAASHLFDHSKSYAELTALEVIEKSNESSYIVARWRIRGVLHLPWRPQLPEWTGSTAYHFDENGLIHRHVESWDITVLEAFTETLFPEVANKIWKRYSGKQ